MFGSRLFVIKTVFVLCSFTALMVECIRQKKDVHHMIILAEENKPSTRYKKHIRSREKIKEKPKKANSEDNTVSASSYENDISDEIIHEKVKPKRHNKKTNHKTSQKPYRPNHLKTRNKSKYQNDDSSHDFLNYQNAYGTSGLHQWAPMDSQEFYYENHYQYQMPSYMSGKIIYPEEIDITTSLPNYYNMYNSGGKLYPTISSNYNQYNMDNIQTEYSAPLPIKALVHPYETMPYHTIQDNYKSINVNQPFQDQSVQSSNVITAKHASPTYVPMAYKNSVVAEIKNITMNQNITKSEKNNQKFANKKKEIEEKIIFGARKKIKQQ